jgi:uncharacterized protein with PIN domain
VKFLVDAMLGKLAKWLKILGFDTDYRNKTEDRELLRIARAERRILLTRDHNLLAAAQSVRGLLVESDDWRSQLAQVLEAFGLRDSARPFTRCLSCNVGLKPLAKKNARNLVAPFVYEKARSFAICPACGRIYWPGTHFGDMDRKLVEILTPGKEDRPRSAKAMAERLKRPYNKKQPQR